MALAAVIGVLAGVTTFCTPRFEEGLENRMFTSRTTLAGHGVPGFHGVDNGSSSQTSMAGLGIFHKVSHTLNPEHLGWRVALGEFLEGRHLMGAVCVLILIDLAISFFVSIAEGTKIINPEYDKQTEEVVERSKKVALTILVLCFIEQIGHLVAFGWKFWTKPWFVLDLAIVMVTMVLELNERRIDKVEHKMKTRFPQRAARLIVILRLWKLAAFLFDMMYLEMTEHTIAAAKKHAAEAYAAKLSKLLVANGIPVPPP